MEHLDFLLYVDDRYLESVYNLYYPNVVEATEGKNKERKNKIGLATKLLANFPINISSESAITFENISIMEKKIHPSLESKIIRILKEKFKEDPVVLLNIIDKLKENGIYYFQGVFELITIENKNGKEIISNKKYRDNPQGLVWKMKLSTYGESVNVYMALGGDKILINYHHLTEEIEKYKKFTFKVLGKITKLDEINFTIKPIVIFYV